MRDTHNYHNLTFQLDHLPGSVYALAIPHRVPHIVREVSAKVDGE